jgi:outer membrane lipoprotein-sorting protein
MKQMRKLIPLLVTVIFIFLVGLVSCAQKTPTAEEIVNSAVAAMSKVDTYKYELDMKTDFFKYNVTNNETSGDNLTAKDAVNIIGIFGYAKEEMQADLDYKGWTSALVLGEIVIPQGPEMRQLLSLEFITSGNASYVGPGVSSSRAAQWVKTNVGMWEYLDQATQQIDMLKTANKVDFTGMEKVDGVDCYILEVTPDNERLTLWLSRQLTLISFGNLQAKKEDLFFYSIRLWITKDSHLFNKTELDLKRHDRDGYCNTEGQLSFYDYNQPVSIMIPQDARNVTPN